MKNRPALFTTLAIVAFSVSACFGIDEPPLPADTGTPPAVVGGYELGLAKGRADGAGGLSRNPERHSQWYSQADRSEFFRGYEAGYNSGMKSTAKGAAGASYGQPLTAANGQGTVTVMEGKRKVSVCRAASPNIEQTKFINEQQQIVVKSRGRHGPATVQLFSTSNGAEQGRVMAFEIRNGNPPWAAGMQE